MKDSKDFSEEEVSERYNQVKNTGKKEAKLVLNRIEEDKFESLILAQDERWRRA